MFGVFFEYASDIETNVVLVRVEDTVEDAILWLARYAVHHAYGVLDREQFSRLVDLLDKMRETNDTSNVIKLGKTDYYARALEEHEIAYVTSQ